MQSIVHKKEARVFPDVLTEKLPREITEAVLLSGIRPIEELRLRAGRRAQITSGGKNLPLDLILDSDALSELLKSLCACSLYAYESTIREGYVPLPGGIRVGVCGRAGVKDGEITGVRDISALVFRLPNAPRVNADRLIREILNAKSFGGLLLYAPPGVGKTTVLRAAAVSAAGKAGLRTVIVDTREELTGTVDGTDLLLDILTGYPRAAGIGIAVRCLGAELILCDEIGTDADADAILASANCGVPVIATAHAATAEGIYARPALRRLCDAGVFLSLVRLGRGGADGMTYTFSPVLGTFKPAEDNAQGVLP